MVYGPKWRTLVIRHAIILGLAFLIMLINPPGPRSDPRLWVVFSLVVAVWIFLVWLKSCVRVRVTNTAVEQVFLSRLVIRRLPLSRYEGIEPDIPAAVFDGKRIVLPGVDSLSTDLPRINEELTARSILASAAEQTGCDRPPCPIVIRREWLEWQDGTVRCIAQKIADEQTLDQIPILADALEDAGCTEPTILSHLRSPGPHTHTCWALEMILRKS